MARQQAAWTYVHGDIRQTRLYTDTDTQFGFVRQGRYQVANEKNDNFQFYIGIECKVRNLNLIKLQVMMKTEEVSPV